jgi:glycosyltransferase involved in cell wall biosynthesis
MNRPQKIIFYDRHTSGHHLEYLRYLVDYCQEHDLRHVHFALPQDAVEDFESKERTAPLFHVVTPPTKGNQLAQTRMEGEWLVHLVKEHGFTDLFFMNFDPYQYIVGTKIFRSLPCCLHGILFSPPHRLFPAPDSLLREKIRQFGRRSRKFLQLRWAMRNPRLASLLILDDDGGAHQLNHLGTTRVMILSDPIDQITVARPRKLPYDILPGSKILLAFGSIIPRKNLSNIIRSLRDCGGEKITLLIAGKGKPEYVASLEALIRAYEGDDTVRVIIENRFVSNDEMEELFAAADGIVMVYLNFYGSSGVLGRSAKYATPVLVANGGLIPALTLRYRLGVAVAGDPSSIGRGIRQLLCHGLSSGYGGTEYLAPKTPTKFCETIFSVLEPLTEV